MHVRLGDSVRQMGHAGSQAQLSVTRTKMGVAEWRGLWLVSTSAQSSELQQALLTWPPKKS